MEDKTVQQAVVTILNQIYEEDFLGFSYGFRPGRNQHQALDALSYALLRMKVNYASGRPLPLCRLSCLRCVEKNLLVTRYEAALNPGVGMNRRTGTRISRRESLEGSLDPITMV